MDDVLGDNPMKLSYLVCLLREQLPWIDTIFILLSY
jgi:hypothetical protein